MSNVKTVTMDGTTGGVITGLDDWRPNLQLSIAGRATGVVSVKFKSVGSDFFEDSTPATTLDLSVTRTVLFEGYYLAELQFSISAAGDDFIVTALQK